MAVSALTSAVCNGGAVLSLSSHILAHICATVPVCAAIVAAACGALHRLLRCACRATYGQASTEQQLVTLMHVLFAVLYSLQLIPYTYFVCVLLFSDSFFLSLLRWHEVPLAILMRHSVQYAVEAALRAAVRPNPLLLLHHACSLAIIAVAFYSTTVIIFVLKLGLILDCMATYEGLLFATLAARKLGARRRTTRALMAAGLGLYAATRVLQLVALIPLFVGSYGPLSGCGGLGMWWAMLALTSLLLLIQLYTFAIYMRMWRRDSGRASLAAGTSTSTQGGDPGKSDSRLTLESPDSAANLKSGNSATTQPGGAAHMPGEAPSPQADLSEASPV